MKKVKFILLFMLVVALFSAFRANNVSAASKVKSIEIKQLPDKRAYNLGEGYTTKGLVVEATMSDGSKVKVDNSKITSFSGVTLTEGRAFGQAGWKSVELKYEGAKTSFGIAVFDPKQSYYITFDANGGDKVDKIKIDASTKDFDLPKATKKGAKFLGWYHSNGNKYTKYEQGMGPSLEFKAKWAYEITFNANGGTGKMDKGYISDDYKLPKSKFTRKGYKFVGWSTKKTADDSSFYETGDISSNIPSKNKAVTLYAQWVKEKAYKITYVSVKGVKLPSKAITKYTAGKRTELPYPQITNDYPSKSVVGVSFIGWKVVANGKDLGVFLDIPPYMTGDLKLTPVVYDLEG